MQKQPNTNIRWLRRMAALEYGAVVSVGGLVLAIEDLVKTKETSIAAPDVVETLLFNTAWKPATKYLPEEAGSYDVRCLSEKNVAFETKAWFEPNRGWCYPGSVKITHWRKVLDIVLTPEEAV